MNEQQALALDRPGGTVSADAAAAFATLAVLEAEAADAASAFATSESSRAFDIRGGIAVNERDISRGMSADERERERALAAQLLTRSAQLTREKGLPKPDPSRVADLEKSVEEATAARRTWMSSSHSTHPELRDWRGLAPPRPLADALQLLSSPSDVLLSFVLDEDDLLMMMVSRGAATDSAGQAKDAVVVDAHVTPVRRRQVAELVAALQKPEVLSDVLVWRKAAAEMTALVPKAVADRLSTATRVFVIPHDMLWRVPFEALPSGDGFLIESGSVALGGSLSSLIRSEQGRTDPHPGGAGLVAVGDVDLSSGRVDKLKQVAPNWPLRQRDQAAAEINGAAASYESGRATLLTRTTATEREVRNRFATMDVLHVAAPFRINAVSPLFSQVLLTAPDPIVPQTDKVTNTQPSPPPPAPVDSTDDGALELREVMNLESPARLAVFSDGAATSMRDGASAADVLQWGWLAAGVPALLVARWSSPSASSERLLAEFHKHVHSGTAPADALRAAQRVVRTNKETAAPVHWAGWMLVSAR